MSSEHSKVQFLKIMLFWLYGNIPFDHFTNIIGMLLYLFFCERSVKSS